MDANKNSDQFDNHVFAARRQHMVQAQIYSRGIRNRAVLEAFRKVPRHCFVPPESAACSYADHPLPIASGQTISQPYIVAYILQALQLRPSDRTLEIGAGSGYQTALLAELVNRLHSIEFFDNLATSAQSVLAQLNYTNVEIQRGDGSKGWPEHAPYDAIVGSAAAEIIPSALIEQLAMWGRLIMPVGDKVQHLVLVTRTPEGTRQKLLVPVRFVPMQTTRN